MCGPLNLRLAAPDKWASIQQIVSKEPSLRDKKINLNFLDEIYVPKNTELGTFLETLYPGGHGYKDLMGLTMNKSSMSFTNMKETFHSSSKLAKAHDTGMDVIVEDVEQDKEFDFPNYHALKMCVIGKAFSGKKT